MGRLSVVDKITDLEIDNIQPYSNSKYEGIEINWSSNIGFGQCNIYKEKESDDWKVATEYMCSNEDKKFLKMLLEKIADLAEVIE